MAVGAAIGYQNAGTVEFILDPGGDFYFLEVNTRLQVEHPVTEMITGLDLVEEQLRVAQGEPLRFTQEDLTSAGASVECRLYAEDVESGFLPSIGELFDFHLEPMEGVRLDTGVVAGSEVSMHYDPMLAKIITHAANRLSATRLMVRALRRLSVHGVRTNRAFLIRVLEHPAYLAGAIDTHFLDTWAAELLPGEDSAAEDRAAVALTLASHEARKGARALPTIATGFRNNPYQDQLVRYAAGPRELTVGYRNLGEGRLCVTLDPLPFGTVLADGEQAPEPFEVRVVAWDAPNLTWEDASGVRRRTRVVSRGDQMVAQDLDSAHTFQLLPRFPDPRTEEIAGALTAPMPGSVLQILVEVGQHVKAGQTLVILEAMKMEQPVAAPEDGVIAELLVEVGQQVDVDALLVVLEAGE